MYKKYGWVSSTELAYDHVHSLFIYLFIYLIRTMHIN